MIGQKTEKDFELGDYDEFYSHHRFQPMSEEDAFNVHEVIPRFGWAFDRIYELGTECDGKCGTDDEKVDGLRVLDLGCLDGSFILTLSKHQPWVEGYGVDLTKDGINLAKERAKEMYEPQPIFQQGTIEDLLSQYAHIGLKFDVITAFEIMEHVKDPEAVVEAIDKVLAPGGVVLFSTPDFESPVFGKDDEINKCHIRLFTMADEDYEATNKFGTKRKATSMPKLLEGHTIKTMEVMSHLINVEYTNG